MSNSRAVESDHRRSSPYWLARLAFFFAIAMATLCSVAAFAEDEPVEENSRVEGNVLLQAPKSYRQHALTGLLTNERRSLDQRVERVMRDLERIGSDGSPKDVQLPLKNLQQKLIALERRLGEVDDELAELKPGFEAEPTSDAGSDSLIFIPAIKPRLPETSALDGSERYPLELRLQIQEALVFLGGYDSSIDGDFDARTTGAVRRYQAEIGADPTGRLTEDQVKRLLDAAEVRRRETGLQPLVDDDVGFRLIYPSALLTSKETADGGYHALSDDSGRARLQVIMIDSRNLRTIYEDLTRHAGLGYRQITETWFVASGEVEGETFYAMGRRAAEGSIIMHLTYPSAEHERWDPFTVILYNSFELTGSS